jgi:hypothetical protein
MVNRVTFDRMVAALQVFSQPSGDQSTVAPVSPAIRELLLYSYPNSIIQVQCLWLLLFVVECYVMVCDVVIVLYYFCL